MGEFTTTVVLREGSKGPSIAAGSLKHVYRNPGRSDPERNRVHMQAYLRAEASKQWWSCPTCGQDLGPDVARLPPPRSCPKAECKAQRKRPVLMTRSDVQRANTSTRLAVPRSAAGDTTQKIVKLNSRLVTTPQEGLIEGVFWSSYLPQVDRDKPISALVAKEQGQAAYQMLREITSGSPLIKRCWQAVAFANLGREKGDRRLNMRGAHIYSSLLVRIRDMVAARITSPGQRDELLVACLVMCTYELLRDDTEADGWYFSTYFSHVQGMCQVLRTVHIPGEPSMSMKYAWRETRLNAGRSAMFLRQPVFGLERPKQWASATASSSLCDDMLDSMFDLAKWFPLVDRLTKSGLQSDHPLETVISRGLQLAGDLVLWEERAVALYCDSERPSLYSLCESANGELLNVLTHYWMICMLLHSQLQLLKDRFSLSNPNIDLPFWIDGWPYAVLIGVVGPMFSQPKFGIWAGLASHTPMIATIFYFSATGNWDTPEAQSLRDFVQDEHRPGNALMRRFFYGMFASRDDLIPRAPMIQVGQSWFGIVDSTPWMGADVSKK